MSVPVVVASVAVVPVVRSASCRSCRCRSSRCRCRSCRCRWSSSSVVVVSVVRRVGLGRLGLRLRLAARRGDPAGEVADARLQARRAGARRPTSGRSSRSFWALTTACCRRRAVAGAVVGRDLVQRALQARRVARRDPAASPPQADEQRRSRRRSTSAASGGRTRILIDRTPGARPASRAGARRGSRPRRRRCRTRSAASGRSRRSVSSSSQAARASPSRGWPTLPGLRSHSPLGDVDLLAAAARRRRWPARPRGARTTAPRASGRRATGRSGWASRHSSASRAERTYSHTGSRGRRVVEPDAALRALRASATPASRGGRRR